MAFVLSVIHRCSKCYSSLFKMLFTVVQNAVLLFTVIDTLIETIIDTLEYMSLLLVVQAILR